MLRDPSAPPRALTPTSLTKFSDSPPGVSGKSKGRTATKERKSLSADARYT